MMTARGSKTVVAMTAFALLFAGPALAQTVAYKADLTGAAEVPPNASKGQGTVMADYDPSSKTMTWTVTFTDLSGPVTAAHFHGPAAAGANAPPVVPIKGEMVSPIKGSVTLTEDQASALESGLVYFNLHTANFPNGEVRGQMAK